MLIVGNDNGTDWGCTRKASDESRLSIRTGCERVPEDWDSIMANIWQSNRDIQRDQRTYSIICWIGKDCEAE